jgi:hypothetical protein
MNCLLRRSAQAIDGHTGDRLRQSRRECSGSGDVTRLGTDRVQTTQDHVVDRSRIDVVTADEGVDECAAMSAGCSAANPPLRLPTAVRAASTMKASAII